MASSLGLSENGFACTMLINTGLSSKFSSPTVVFGPVGTLVLEGRKTRGSSSRPLVLTRCYLWDRRCSSPDPR
jgi:hypothetical protein